MRYWVTAVVATFLLASLGLAGLMYVKLPLQVEIRMDLECERFDESEWGFIAPPMEKNNAWIEQKERCEAREKNRNP